MGCDTSPDIWCYEDIVEQYTLSCPCRTAIGVDTVLPCGCPVWGVSHIHTVLLREYLMCTQWGWGVPHWLTSTECGWGVSQSSQRGWGVSQSSQWGWGVSHINTARSKLKLKEMLNQRNFATISAEPISREIGSK